MFKMKGSSMHVGTTEHKSALKQKSSWDETEVKKGTDDKRGNATTTTERIKGKANDTKEKHQNKTYGATDVKGYQDSETARDTYVEKEKATKKKYKTKAAHYSKDDKGTITKKTTKYKKTYGKNGGKDIVDEDSSTKTPKTKVGQWVAKQKMKTQERNAEKYKEENQ